MIMIADPDLRHMLATQPYPLLFATMGGAHLYGFASPYSDYNLRGAHVLPLESVVGLDIRDETVERSMIVPYHPHRLPQGGKGGALEIDLVTQDVRKFIGLLLMKNGHVLEQLFSPLVVQGTPEHWELLSIAHGCITRHHCHHYFGFAETQWKLFDKERPRRVKPLLHVYRALLTGIHLMCAGKVEADLVRLNEEFRLPYIADLVARKFAGPEQSSFNDTDIAFHGAEYKRLRIELQAAHDASQLPESPGEETRAALNDLLVRVRLKKPPVPLEVEFKS